MYGQFLGLTLQRGVMLFGAQIVRFLSLPFLAGIRLCVKMFNYNIFGGMFGIIKKNKNMKLKERLVLAAMANPNCGSPVRLVREAYDFICRQEQGVASMKLPGQEKSLQTFVRGAEFMFNQIKEACPQLDLGESARDFIKNRGWNTLASKWQTGKES